MNPIERPKILFVDDEPSILEGLAIHARRKFQVSTATSGAEGLQRLKKEGPFAIVVSDMRMPEMDGSAFLREVRLNAPDTIRMLLTGYADLESAMNVVNEGYVFRFLTKPCDPGSLHKAFDSALEQRRLASADKLLLEDKVQQITSQLFHAERLATLGTLAGGVGHELNNVMLVFMSTLSSIRSSAEGGLPPSSEDIEELSWVSEHLQAHASHLLNLGRNNAEEDGSCDLSALLENTLSILQTAGRTKCVEIEPSIPNTPIWIKASRVRIEQILINLIGNAVDATEGIVGRYPKLKISLQRNDTHALCCLQDNGCGIPADKLEAIFAPYYTTKPPNYGTGLGLSVVKQIVESYHGKLSVESTPDVGSSFRFTVPLLLLQ
jgi:C4-dicarboxylate-specific signal transduction histidine kinase